MEDEDADADLHAIPKGFRERPEDDAPLPRSGGAVAVGGVGVALDELVPRLGAAKLGRIGELLGRIGRDRLHPVDRPHDPVGPERRIGGHARMNSVTAAAVASTCASVSSANIGSERTSPASRSVTGRSPLRYPRNAAASCMWIGTG